jgi:thiosulfate/3-mercaptopyruvate sulfurtransferase
MAASRIGGMAVAHEPFGNTSFACVDRRNFIRLLGGASLSVAGVAAMASARSASAAAAGTPATGFANADWLVDARWLAERVSDSSLRVIALTPRESFEAGHIPGAQQIDWPDLDLSHTTDEAIEAWRSDVVAKLEAMGVNSETTVLIYDDGTLFASRLWWILDYLGHDHKVVLDGGLAAWRSSAQPIAPGPAALPTAVDFGETTLRTQVLANQTEVRTVVDQGGSLLIDARTMEDYKAGHIPGAVCVPRSDNAIRSTPKVWRTADELRTHYQDAGVKTGQRVIVYSNEGVRAAAAYFTLRLLGHADVALYPGSWREWSRDPDMPIETGE